MAKKEYTAIKNYIHNEAGLSKELIKEIAEEYLQKSIDKMIADKIDSNWIETLIVRKIGEVITGERDYSGMGRETKCTDFIKETIKETVKKEVHSRINFKNLELTLEKV